VAICEFMAVQKSYRSGWTFRSNPVLREVSFSVEPGETLALLGHNGAGKTTSLKALLGLIRIEAGEIRVLDEAPGSRAALGRLGYLPENPYFYDHLSGREFLGLVGELHGLDRRTQEKRIDETLELVEMSARADGRMRAFSKGMLQRMGLAQALMNDPEFLILDEPMGGLDPVGRHQIRCILGELRARGKTVLISSHILSDVESIADRAVILKGGAVAREVDLSEVDGGERTWQVFFRDLPAAGRAELEAAGYDISGQQDGTSIEISDAGGLPDALRSLELAGAHLIRVQPQRTEDLESIFVSTVVGQSPKDIQRSREDVGRILDSMSEVSDSKTENQEALR
jgi:ABC-2 type transport system ATP-binding protein